jgi:hypothetical protein
MVDCALKLAASTASFHHRLAADYGHAGRMEAPDRHCGQPGEERRVIGVQRQPHVRLLRHGAPRL